MWGRKCVYVWMCVCYRSWYSLSLNSKILFKILLCFSSASFTVILPLQTNLPKNPLVSTCWKSSTYLLVHISCHFGQFLLLFFLLNSLLIFLFSESFIHISSFSFVFLVLKLFKLKLAFPLGLHVLLFVFLMIFVKEKKQM